MADEIIAQIWHPIRDYVTVSLNDGTYTFKFAEFGCRRLSREWEDEVVRRLVTETKSCVGIPFTMR